MTKMVRELGTTGRMVSPLGLGCMGMSWGYAESSRNDAESMAVIRTAVDQGVDFFDTARVYGDGHNERLVGRALKERPDVVIATKGGLVVDDLSTHTMRREATPDSLRRQVDESMSHLGREIIDLYYLHRVDPTVPLEDSWGALADMVSQGKIRWLGLSEVSTVEAARAHAIHPVTAIQSELSLWTRDAQGIASAGHDLRPATAGSASTSGGDVVSWTADHGASFVPFAPLGRGFLTDSIDVGKLDDDDFRKTNPRFQPEAMEHNRFITATVRRIATAHDASPAQVSLAWALGQGPRVLPIPGTRTPRHLMENLGAIDVSLSETDIAELDGLGPAQGSRY
ncbi:aldo/keto reductase [Arthrobacter sp. Y-9]|uniref:aldo/keto reductase n=1 Tax=Arthrobacter sp. Y-9 TaxID=3039385 RepID=UPI00241DFCDA|nr:aldo/keto reductase [Arthrobacter sp. Y-9]WFR83462.1 aldo/keto reductase [Arthrobacter sp. Y-9]